MGFLHFQGVTQGVTDPYQGVTAVAKERGDGVLEWWSDGQWDSRERKFHGLVCADGVLWCWNRLTGGSGTDSIEQEETEIAEREGTER